MEVINSSFSNDIGYLHALRHAPPLPPVIPPVDIVSDPSVKMAATWVIITVGAIVISILIYEKWKDNQNKKKLKAI